ncbi:methionine--tRNA ligase subunit beta, partial [bacterium]|nr:methionine--tRNA ligase subunit beta [bacterium]
KLKKISVEIKHEKQEKREKMEEENNIIDIDTFQKIDIRVARIISCEKIEKSKKLMKIEVDDGDGKRQIIAGIAQHYTPEELTGKQIVILANLKPVKIMGETSNGMLLAASSGEKLVVLTTDEEIEPGSKIS